MSLVVQSKLTYIKGTIFSQEWSYILLLFYCSFSSITDKSADCASWTTGVVWLNLNLWAYMVYDNVLEQKLMLAVKLTVIYLRTFGSDGSWRHFRKDIWLIGHSCVVQYLIQQIRQSVINNHLSLMSLLHVSTSTKSSSGRYIQRHTSTANSVKDVCV
jgi:hypothetical protein